MFIRKKGVVTRWANGENPSGVKGGAAVAGSGRKGAPCMNLFKPGDTLLLAHAEQSGIIRHIWITMENRRSPLSLKGIKLECFWDGASKPAVSVPLGDFFCFNSGVLSPLENEYFSNPEGRSFNCYIAMPFRTGMHITVTNETETLTEGQFFYQIDYTLGDDVSDAMYFHAYYNRELCTAFQQDYTILPMIKGYGRYLGASFGVIANPALYTTWWGEGEVKCYIDGDNEYPTLAGTGTEDYIGTGWGQGRFINRFQGCVHADESNMRYSFYRFHVPDPVYFSESCRVTIQQIGHAQGANIQRILDDGIQLVKNSGEIVTKEDDAICFERFGDDWCSVAYFYFEQPITELAPIPGSLERAEKYL